MEERTGAIPSLEGKIKALEKRIQEHEGQIREVGSEGQQGAKAVSEKLDRLQAAEDELFRLSESNRASFSRVTFDVEENATRLSTHLAGVETRLAAELGLSREQQATDMHAAQSRISNQLDEVRKNIEAKDLSMITTTRRQYTAINEEMDSFRRKWDEDLESLSDRVKHDSNARLERVQSALSSSMEQLQSVCEEQAGVLVDLEDGFGDRVAELQGGLREMSAVHELHSASYKSIEGRLGELSESNRLLGESVADMGQSRSFASPFPNVPIPGGSGLAWGAPSPGLFPPHPMSPSTGGAGGPAMGAYGNNPYFFPYGMPQAPQSAPSSPSVGRAGDRSRSPTSSSRARAKKGEQGEKGEKSDSTVEVLNEFMDIYDTDQADIVKRLDELGAKPSDPVETWESEKATPGEVLGNFFLTYKKDRMEILSRLGSLSASPPRNRNTHKDRPPFFKPQSSGGGLTARAQLLRRPTSSTRPLAGKSPQRLRGDTREVGGTNTLYQGTASSNTARVRAGVGGVAGVGAAYSHEQMARYVQLQQELTRRTPEERARLSELVSTMGKPVWRVPNTYQSPPRSPSSSTGRSATVSPASCTRTTSSLLHRDSSVERERSGRGRDADNSPPPVSATTRLLRVPSDANAGDSHSVGTSSTTSTTRSNGPAI
ncbi:hypothetical protein B484DRAFT_2750 [Ochromonadaceae sp. CCMP2298]|nr:hypothetical protein B484DRAFT_2750 [Ochromonadaceae sp. CCMP2298]